MIGDRHPLNDTDRWGAIDLDYRHAQPARVETIKRRATEHRPSQSQKTPTGRLGRRLQRHDVRATIVRSRLWKRPVLLLERFPATILFGLQYGLLVVRPAIQHHTPPEALIVKVCLAGIAIAFSIEVLLAPLSPRRREIPTTVTPRSAMVVFVIGAAATIIAGLLGTGSYAVQVGTASVSRAASLFTPLANWMLFGVLMMLWLYRTARVSRRYVGLILIVAFALQVGLSLKEGFFAPLLGLALPVVVAMLLSRLIRARLLLVVILVASLAAPTLLSARNNRRISLGGTAGYQGATSVSARLRLDQEFTEIRLLGSLPAHIGQPGVTLLLRIGLLPRAIDSGRPTLNSAEDLSVAIGGSPTNSAALTSFGEAYAYDGRTGLVALVALLTIALAVAVRRRSLWSFVFVGVLIQNGLSIFTSYPNELSSILQSAESIAAAMAFCWLMSRLASHSEPSPKPGIR